eukprot:CAMPEP_0114488846 /NCGR_PEP_ID=MMETSP0109-20121206/1554_1 /TAXON_ID=29199 /ORGANISM="Chlorarachnion reptans, Strain CCCM449" /LENGTH=110 /DNA_ID=CAMNT_0001665279 /DNA_START=389 /DNA_END=718 /DNA_ORIENTATION=-
MSPPAFRLQRPTLVPGRSRASLLLRTSTGIIDVLGRCAGALCRAPGPGWGPRQAVRRREHDALPVVREPAVPRRAGDLSLAQGGARARARHAAGAQGAAPPRVAGLDLAH